MLKIVASKQFTRDCKKHHWLNQGKFDPKLAYVIDKLAAQLPLDAKYRDHKLTNYNEKKDYRECHVDPDRLLVYRIKDQELMLQLIRIGSHSELFGSAL